MTNNLLQTTNFYKNSHLGMVSEIFSNGVTYRSIVLKNELIFCERVILERGTYCSEICLADGDAKTTINICTCERRSY